MFIEHFVSGRELHQVMPNATKYIVQEYPNSVPEKMLFHYMNFLTIAYIMEFF